MGFSRSFEFQNIHSFWRIFPFLAYHGLISRSKDFELWSSLMQSSEKRVLGHKFPLIVICNGVICELFVVVSRGIWNRDHINFSLKFNRKVY